MGCRAEKRGLYNLKTTPDAMPYFVLRSQLTCSQKQEVFTDVEVKTRGEIMMEDYNNTLHFEMLTMLEMAKQEILPACLKYTKFVTDDIASKKALGLDALRNLKRLKDLQRLQRIL